MRFLIFHVAARGRGGTTVEDQGVDQTAPMLKLHQAMLFIYSKMVEISFCVENVNVVDTVNKLLHTYLRVYVECDKN